MSDGVIAEYAGRLRALCEKEGLSPLDRGALRRFWNTECGRQGGGTR